MMSSPMITSLLDTDLYKFTMMQCIFHQLRPVTVRYQFTCRKNIDLTTLIADIQGQLELFCELKLTPQEANYLNSLRFFKEDFIQYLKNIKLDPKQVTIQKTAGLSIHIEGSWLDTILFEVPLLAIISECYYKKHYPNYSLSEGRARLQSKITEIKQHTTDYDFSFSDFGTRRRFSKEWQREVLLTLQEALPHCLVGTSNLAFAHSFGLNPIGTMAHEYLQAFQVLAPDIKHSQALALSVWLQEYHGALGIALTDALGVDQFLTEFNHDLSQRFSGLRHDSGDPLLWADKILAHYQKMHIDAQEKCLVFSDSLTIAKAIHIYHYIKKRAKPMFGIGTHLMNDVGLAALDIVLKMTEVNGTAVIKYPDTPGKIVSTNEQRLNYLKKELKLKSLV